MSPTEIDGLEREARADEYNELRWNRHFVLELIGEIRLLQAEKGLLAHEYNKCLTAKLRLMTAMDEWHRSLNDLPETIATRERT